MTTLISTESCQQGGTFGSNHSTKNVKLMYPASYGELILHDVSGNEDSVPCSRGPAPYHVYVQGKQRITELIRDHFEELHSPKTVTLILKKVTAIITENIVAEDVFEVSVEGARWSFPRQVFCERWPWILSAAAFCEGQGRQTLVNLDKTPCNSHLAFLATLEFVFGNSARIFSSSVENAILGIQIGSFMVLNGLVATLDNCFRTGELELSDDIVGGVLGLIDNISCHVLRTKCIALYLQRPGLLNEDFVTGRIGKHIWLDVVAMEKAMRSSPSKHWRFDRANPPTSYTELVQLCKESIDDQEFRLKNSETREFERGLHWDETAEIDPSQMAKLKAERREWLVRQKWP